MTNESPYSKQHTPDKKRETTTQRLTRQLANANAKLQVAEDDGIKQRKLIERITRLVKDWQHVLPETFYKRATKKINEYERRFTLIGGKLRDNHPVFKDKTENK